jgi:hypothetical protein
MPTALGAVLVATLTVLLAPGAVRGALPSGVPKPSQFSAKVDNPWFPLKPGTTYVYRGEKDGKPARDVVTVTHAVTRINGVPCVLVHDRLYERGRLRERTTDWYSQDAKGNVWYFGEETAELDAHGRVTSTEGTWRAGRDGAIAGIYMPAHPRVGQSGRQEYYKGHAEDHFAVVSLHAEVKAPYVSSKRALLTKEWTPLEPGALDHKFYVRGIGTVLEVTVRGGSERAALISVHRGAY